MCSYDNLTEYATQATLPAPVLERTQPNEVMAVAPLKSEGSEMLSCMATQLSVIRNPFMQAV